MRWSFRNKFTRRNLLTKASEIESRRLHQMRTSRSHSSSQPSSTLTWPKDLAHSPQWTQWIWISSRMRFSAFWGTMEPARQLRWMFSWARNSHLKVMLFSIPALGEVSALVRTFSRHKQWWALVRNTISCLILWQWSSTFISFSSLRPCWLRLLPAKLFNREWRSLLTQFNSKIIGM